MSSQIEIALDLVSVVSLMIISAGMIKDYLYYKMFGIRIFSFLSIDEIIISFADNLLYYLLILISSAFFLISFIANSEVLLPSISHLSLISRLVEYFGENIPALFITIALNAAILLFGYLRKKIQWFETLLNIILSWIAFWLLPIILFEFQISTDISNSGMSNHYIITMAISLALYSIMSAFNEAYKVKHYKHYHGTEVELEDEIITSDDTYYYVGHSKNYIFFFDSELKASEVWPIATVKRFKFIK
ncbi:hypothetical protein [Pseudochryseolinea flava]|uniref:Uncharacterized protein n=1 Tax=Pseudochryseolinea flava TaxID=2059302 RepID=A0A364Y452_9BACT|nr:hypothetical protein [Pseudochryseolinea flava]RAW01104.1 hypothetical protein DQQ10_12815 [Pseudochryseolinea flava]